MLRSGGYRKCFGGSQISPFFIVMVEYLVKSLKHQYLSKYLSNEDDTKDKIIGNFMADINCFNDFTGESSADDL